MAKSAKSAPPTPATVRVYPEPSLPEGSFVAGVGADGADVSAEEAKALLLAGVVTKKTPADPAPEG